MKNRGFTLLETIIYVALLGILMSGSLVSIYTLLDGGSKNESALAIQEEGTFISRKLSWALSGASAVALSGTTLTITRPDLGAESPIVLSVSGASLFLKRTGSSPLVLNSASIPLSNIAFSIVPPVGSRPTSVQASFLVKDKPFIFKTYLRQ